MKIVVLERKNSKKLVRKLIDTLEEPDYKEKYMQVDGTPFDNEGEGPKAKEVLAPKPIRIKITKIKVKKPKAKKRGRPKKK